MRAAFPEAEARVARFYDMQAYHLGWRDERLAPASFDPGKLLRPYLAILGCQVAGGDPVSVLPLAAAIQLIHDFSLIHDDIEDDSDTRRGRTTVWKLWGLAQGINTGDGMFVIAHLALHRLAEQHIPATRVLDVARRFDQTILRICEGQYLDLSYEGDLTIDEDAYLAMISRKTAALTAAATALGALAGGGDANTVTALSRYGENLGLAFQVQDDVLGIWGDPEVTGKPFAADLYRRKLSLPVIHALRQGAQRGELEALYRQERLNDADVRRALDILDSSDARAHTEQIAGQYHARSLDALAEVSGPQARGPLEELRALASGLVGRQT
jgi:geranylgeranyl diphosphate synthase type I